MHRMSLSPNVGPYVLDRIIGHGGTSTVWLAQHRELDSDVVLKVLTAKFTKRARFREYFANEIRAVARLNHPNIARVLDAGVEEGGSSPIAAGSPYVVMEYIQDGSLIDIMQELNWTSIRDILLVLLDALAHAHAHDVVHLDLKPGNVLLRRDGNVVVPVLTDFGISRTEDSMAPTERSGVVGTPKYMAPEQIRGEWRRTGPATDLYALGCMAFQMVTGRVPFESGDAYSVLRSHLRDSVPAMIPRTPVPSGFPEWVARLLEKEPGDRYEAAADAAFALIRLDANGVDDWTDSVAHDSGRTLPVDLTILDETLNIQAIHESVETIPILRRSLEAPPIPISWQRRVDFRRDVRALGLGLLRDRVPQVVGRTAERNLLWTALTEVAQGTSRAILIHGESGIGATRTAEWLARLAEEVGAAQALTVRSAPSVLEGLGHAVGRKLKVAGGKPMDAVPTVRELLLGGRPATEDDLVDAIILSDLLTGTPSDAKHSEKRSALVRALTALSARRTLVVVCDNVENFHDIWSVAQLIFEEQVPALLLATTTADRMDGLMEVLDHPAVSEMRLIPLPDADIANMADQLVWLTPQTAETLIREAEGYPGRAVRWLTSWVERDLLVPSPNGFLLRRRMDDESLSDAAKKAAEVVLAQFDEIDRKALGVAATFGTRFNTELWFDTLTRMHVSPRPDLLERALRLGLLDRDSEGREYEFSDLTLVDEILEFLAEHGMQSTVHIACADALEIASAGTRDVGRLERIVKHRAAARQFEKALPLLGWVALRNFHGDNIEDARRLLAWHETLLSRADVPTRKREGWMGDIIRLWLREGDGETLESQTVEAAYRGALKANQLVAAADAARLRAKILRSVSLESANEALEEAANAISAAGGEGLPEVAAFWVSLGWNRGLQGQYEVAFAYFLRAEPIFELANDSYWVSHLGRARAYLNLQRGHYESARDDVSRATEIARKSGNRNGLAGCYMYLGELDRYEMAYESARSHYLAAYDLYRKNPSNRWIAECNIVLCEIGAGNMPAAERVLQRLIDTSQYQRKLFAPFQLAQAVAEASQGDWSGYDRRFAEVLAELRRLKHVEYDIAWLCDRAGEVAERSGHHSRAHAAYEASAQIWDGLGRQAELLRTQDAMDRVRLHSQP